MTKDNGAKAWEMVHRLQVDKMNEGTGVMLPWEPTVAMVRDLLDRIDELEDEIWHMS